MPPYISVPLRAGRTPADEAPRSAGRSPAASVCFADRSASHRRARLRHIVGRGDSGAQRRGGDTAELSNSRLSCLYLPPFSPGVGLRGAPSEGKGETTWGEPYVATT